MAGKREEQLKEITERLEQGVKELFTSEKYTDYLKTMSQFHNYSFNNTLLIAMQKTEPTLVAGLATWNKKFNRRVKRGEKGIKIIASAPIREKEEIEKFDLETNEPMLRPDGQPETEEVEHIIPRFRVATVFDISQTHGDPLSELDTPGVFFKEPRRTSGFVAGFGRCGEKPGYARVLIQVEMMISRAEYGHVTLGKEAHNLAVQYAYKLDNPRDTRELVKKFVEAMENSETYDIQEIMEEAQAEIDSLLDNQIGLMQMHEYGYRNDSVQPLTVERAVALHNAGLNIYSLHK